MKNISIYIKEKFQKLTSVEKISIFVGLILIIVILSVGVPSLARYKNRNPLDLNTVWNGEVATSYRNGSGTIDDPYIISNGEELAYFSSMLKTTDYKDKYFKLNNNIVLNNGTFGYDTNVKYTLNTTEFYVKEFTNEFYDNASFDGVKIGNINVFEPINGFKGHFDGDGHIIYGLYVHSGKNTALFTNLSGTVENLYLKNSMIYGGQVVGGVSSNTDNAVIKNVMNEGFVIGQKDDTPLVLSTDVQNIELIVGSSYTEYVDVLKSVPVIDGVIEKVTLTGKLEMDNNGTVLVDGNEVMIDSDGKFEVDLGTGISTYITVNFSSSVRTTFKLSNLKYNIVYNQLISGGIVGISNNTSYENVINKAYVYGILNSGGIAGFAKGTTNILQTYNTGSINAIENAGGLISLIKNNTNNVSINKSYNTGVISSSNLGGIISILDNNTGAITIENSIDKSESGYVINTVKKSNVSITNSYRVSGYNTLSGSTTGIFELNTNVTDKETLQDTLLFNEFVDNTDVLENESNVWIYEDDSLPILYIDDLNKPIAILNVNTTSYNDLGYELSPVYYDEQISFSINGIDELRPIKEIYYYVSKSMEALSRSEIESITEWQSYSDIVQITEEGFYVVYAKIVTEGAMGIDNVTYINSECLVLDLSTPNVEIKYDSYLWNEYKEEIDYVYINKGITVSINGVDAYSGVKELSYYISSTILTIDELNNLEGWNEYTEDIVIDNLGSYIIYAKVVDNVDKITYVNTDVITYGGYSLNNIYAGRNLLIDNYNITSKSEVTYNFTYSDTNPYKEGYTHNIISDKLLPIGTKIIITDNITNKKYVYKLFNEEKIIKFSSFKEMGIDSDVYFKENITDGVDDNFTVTLDFSETNIDVDILDLKIHLAIYDSMDVKVRTTLESNIKGINIYVGESNTYISTTYNGTSIAYDSSSETSIPLVLGVNYPSINLSKISDTVIEDKILGIMIKMVDEDGNIVEKKYLKNIKYSVLGTEYGIDNDGIARINLNNGINTFNNNLVITTSLDNGSLPSGNYFFKIYSYASYDGMYSDKISDTVVTIPVTNNTSKVEYSFDVLLDNENRIISKLEESSTIHFDMLQSGIYNPNIRVSLYKKNELTAFDQSYTLVDLKEFVTNSLESVSDKVYYASKYPLIYNGYKTSYNTLDLKLINSKFENTGYKFVFELYSGNTKIGTIQKKIIVR